MERGIILLGGFSGKLRPAAAIGAADPTGVRPTDKMMDMRTLACLVALAALLSLGGCKNAEKTEAAQSKAAEATYTCACGKTKTAPASQAPS
jgi:hypothetical protein